MNYIVMKIFLAEAFMVFVFITSGFPEVRLFGLSPQMVSELWISIVHC